MRRFPIIIALLAALALTGCGGGGGTKAASAADLPASGPATITAQGTGRVRGVPDLLVVQIGVHTQGAQAKAALEENNAKSKALLDAIKAKGIDDKDVRTTNVSINPTYGNTGKITGYGVDNSVELRLRDLGAAGATLDELASTAGDAIRIGGISFTFDDDTKLLADARTDAVRRAREQANQLATAAGVKLGKVRTLSEVPNGFNQPYPLAGTGAGAPAADSAISLAPGSQQLTLQVTLVYEIVQ